MVENRDGETIRRQIGNLARRNGHMIEERDKKGIQYNYDTRGEKYNESRSRAKAKVRTEYGRQRFRCRQTGGRDIN